METEITSVLFADVKGYSSLNDNQIKSFHTNILPKVAKLLDDVELKHINTWGDGIVIAANNIIDLCDRALAMRDVFEHERWDRYHLLPLQIRISIHVGQYFSGEDKFTEGGVIAGHTIITAARIEPITKPGRVWMTDTAMINLRDAQRGQGIESFAYDEIGEMELPKQAGRQKLYVLRRCNETTLSEAEKQEIFDALKGRKEVLEHRTSVKMSSGYYEVVIAIVIRDGKVLLVRRKENTEGLGWMFPSGTRVPTEEATAVAAKHVFQETGVSCAFNQKVHEIEKHPLTGAHCHYYHLEPLDDKMPENLQSGENLEVKFVPIAKAIEMIGKDLTPEIRVYLEQYI
ncbi:adenylate/guanylate cyclase domain-containing protein [Hyphococcus flavus]|uniref:Adenylate/guanylate cyclase domain-containing protein n=1 Tax=Hyphococcus flavus TaxID=1866326 RepID=A0AAF0CFX9_9PROT|nr:adenylate/guanylate cyclase domain-containing protein [Hyphococcus flavus]WDI31814.1 adenylate/guanylate cyclase domain-containing protein [Hyphococcus flavus]